MKNRFVTPAGLSLLLRHGIFVTCVVSPERGYRQLCACAPPVAILAPRKAPRARPLPEAPAFASPDQQNEQSEAQEPPVEGTNEQSSPPTKRSRSIKIGPSQRARITRDDAKVSAIVRSLGPRGTRHGSALRLEDVGELREAASVAAERHLKQEPPFKDRGDILAALTQLNPDCGAYSKQRFNSTLSEARSRLAALDTQLRSPQPGEKRAGGSSPVRESDDASDATSTGGSTKTGISSTAAAGSSAGLSNAAVEATSRAAMASLETALDRTAAQPVLKLGQQPVVARSARRKRQQTKSCTISEQR